MRGDVSRAGRRSLARGGPAVAVLVCVGALGLAAPAAADAVTEALHAATAAYAQKNYAAALTALTTAATLVRQMKAELWKAVLPEPPPGWTADEAKVVTVGPAVLGGGVSVERHYRHGPDSVDLSLIADSPMLQSVAVLLGAGLLVSGSELLVIEGQRVAYDASDNTLQAIVADKVLVKLQGSRGVDKAALTALFTAIRLRDIEKAAQ
jgi:hypothetical protein